MSNIKSYIFIGKYKIYKPTNLLDAIKLSDNTEWICSLDGAEYSWEELEFDDFSYTYWDLDADIYIVIGNKDKYMIIVYIDNDVTIYDYKNDEISIDEFTGITNIPISKFKWDKSRLDGEYILYNYKGEVIGIRTIKNGKLNGRYIDFDTDLKIKYYGIFKDGLEEGEQLIYENGKVSEKRTFHNGMLDGTVVLYDKMGDMIDCEVWKQDQFMGKC